MNTSHQRHWISISYVNDFLNDVKYCRYSVKVNTFVVRRKYGTLVKIKIKIERNGTWERFSTHIIRIRSPADICVLQATLHNYKTVVCHLSDTKESME